MHMSDGAFGRTIDEVEIQEMVGAIRPDWTVVEAELADRGLNSVYNLLAETERGRRELVLKATPEGGRHGSTPTEARYLSIINDQTSIPVPEIVGCVDEDDDLRAPFFLMESVSGESLRNSEIGSVSDERLRIIAEQTGEYLAQLHDIDAVDRFGRVGWDRSSPLHGKRPSGEPTDLEIVNGFDSWPEWFSQWTEKNIDNLSNTAFSDLIPDLKIEMNERIDDYSRPGSFSPVLARVEHTPDNLILGSDDTIEAVIDWGVQLAVPRAYDLAAVEFILAGSGWMALPSVPDRRELVREGLLTGYRRESTVPDGLESRRDCYQLDYLTTSMYMYDADRYPISEEQKASATEWLRTTAEQLM